jgi:polyphosphate kinase
MTELIEREIQHQNNGVQGHLIFKVNSLVDKHMIQLLYRASQAGVKVDLIVRGICCLRPGLEGVSENIHVISVVGRFLEHSRIYYFHNGSKEEIYLGSADLMPRNINNRVEVLFPVEDPRHIRYLRQEVLAEYFLDNAKARYMEPDGTYQRPPRSSGDRLVSLQSELIEKRRPDNRKPAQREAGVQESKRSKK